MRLLGAAVAALALMTGASAADPVQLKFAFIGIPNGAMNQQGMLRWANAVNQESGGEVEVKIFNGPVLGTLFNIYDRLTNGVVEIAYATVGPIVTQFPTITG